MIKRSKSIVGDLRAAIARAGRRGVTRYAIAKAAGMPQSQVGRIASGESVPRLDTAQAIARVIGYRLALVANKVSRR